MKKYRQCLNKELCIIILANKKDRMNLSQNILLNIIHRFQSHTHVRQDHHQ